MNEIVKRRNEMTKDMEKKNKKNLVKSGEERL